MKTEYKKRLQQKNFLDYLIPEFLVASSDAVLDQNGGLTLVRVIDQLFAVFMPLQVYRFTTVGQFFRNTAISSDDFIKAGLAYKLVISKPSGKEQVLAQGAVLMDAANPWLTTRLLNDLSGMISFDEIGIHVLRIFGKTEKTDYVEVLQKRISIMLVPGINGVYAGNFEVADPKTGEVMEGAGVVVLMPDNSLIGGDHAYSYEGTYDFDNGKLAANLRATRHNKDNSSVFGDFEYLDVQLSGTVDSNNIQATGTSPSAPGKTIHVRMIKQTKPPDALRT